MHLIIILIFNLEIKVHFSKLSKLTSLYFEMNHMTALYMLSLVKGKCALSL